ncbi:hypothetical protein NOK12_02870 [Nocardioides sp. OK12]|uniref:Lipoprotein n=1 Tax=Nocardioides marinisabuli TaxID=419476 RepID=A0A7Y9JQH2_9ACTN|nr:MULTISPECIES: hypothetical protein [Nocardioides]NYD58087.1 hypothetical protein [Nocardioides marinisabuli]GHJ57768.1 hypothetical protein NOK12_02870 [Nocardioides sp. OK12]
MRSTTSTFRTTHRARRILGGVAATALVALPLSACGTENDTAEAASTSESSQSAPEPVAAIDALTGEDTQITLDQGFLDALGQLKLTPGTIGEATLEGAELSFPITGGNVTVFEPGTVSPYVIGQLQHVSSGLSLSAGDTTVQLENLNVDPGVSRVYGDVSVNGKTAVESAFLFQLDGRTLNPLQVEDGQAVLEGTEVKISEPAAGLLNDTFGTDAVKPGLLVGVAEITVDLPA